MTVLKGRWGGGRSKYSLKILVCFAIQRNISINPFQIHTFQHTKCMACFLPIKNQIRDFTLQLITT